MIVHVVGIGEIVNHHHLYFVFTTIYNKVSIKHRLVFAASTLRMKLSKVRSKTGESKSE